MKTFIGFRADEMFIGPAPASEDISLEKFRELVASGQWESRCVPSDSESLALLREKTGLSLPVKPPRMMYLKKDDVYLEVKVSTEAIRFFRHSFPTATP